ncbi:MULTISPECIES: transposase [Chryseobacterium]|uniref:transposase n=1 Tax=Chryseobacterium TaxID=59732 RepID=UPI0012953F78|nr:MULTISPECIES: transposase [Chryseobacterium]MDR6923709.1 hypothetical protein [Chryseobacterium sp. 2987]
MNFKNIHIGNMIQNAVKESGLELFRICNFFQCTEQEIEAMYGSESIDTHLLLKWSKFLEYDFFRTYSQHLILYSPPSRKMKKGTTKEVTGLPQFRKTIYTQEVIDFVLEQIRSENMTRKEVMERYAIPKTTLFKWIEKYNR